MKRGGERKIYLKIKILKINLVEWKRVSKFAPRKRKGGQFIKILHQQEEGLKDREEAE